MLFLSFSHYPFDLQRSGSKRSANHGRCGSGWFTSVLIETFCLFKNSATLRRKTCERVRSCLAQIASTVARIAFGIRKAVGGSDIFNVAPIVVDYGIYDVVPFHLRSSNETRRQFNREIWTAIILIFPSRDVANNLFSVSMPELFYDRRSCMPL